jgi:catechol 2,3-dioxygenase-like lactoylglutathione lyase family enzyme
MSTTTSTSAGAVVDGLIGESITVSFTAKDLKTSVAWYRDVLGMTVAQEHERDGVLRAVAMQAGPVRLLLNQDDGGRGWDRVKGEGFAVQITTAQSIDAIAARVKANGGQLDLEPTDMPWGARIFRLRDPDGFRLSISSPRRA